MDTQVDVIESRAEQRRVVDDHRWNLSPLFGYGTSGYNVGIGARAGYTFEKPVFLGGTFVYHFGEQSIDAQTRFYYPGVEVGYDFGIGPMLLRPYAGAGLLFGRATVAVGGLEKSNTTGVLMVYPGATAHYIFPHSPAFIGGDARLLLPFEKHDVSLSVFGTVGLTL